MPTLDRQNDVFILNIGDTENRFHPDWITSINELIDQVLAAESPKSLVTTATGKFFSNGLDLDWLLANPDRASQYIQDVQALLSRFLTMPLVTVVAMQGHTYAAGAMLSLTHDVRIMRSDRGFWCLPEADIKIPFTIGMSALIQARLSPQAAHETMTLAGRYGGTEALARGLVDQAVGEAELLEAAIAIASTQTGKAGATLGTIKARMYQSVVSALAEQGIDLGMAG